MSENTTLQYRDTPYKTYKGFELFNDIQDVILRTRNRAVVLTNIACDNSKLGLISAKGASLILGYFQQIPLDERKVVKDKFVQTMEERAFKLCV